MQHEREEHHLLDDYEEDAVSANGCSCFRLLPFKWRQADENGPRTLLNQRGEHPEETWLVKKLKKVKEITEVVAGPKWKTFIRKVGGYVKGYKRKQNNSQFQYDPQSYALNFDGGVDRDQEDCFFPGASSRWPATPLNERH